MTEPFQSELRPFLGHGESNQGQPFESGTGCLLVAWNSLTWFCCTVPFVSLFGCVESFLIKSYPNQMQQTIEVAFFMTEPPSLGLSSSSRHCSLLWSSLAHGHCEERGGHRKPTHPKWPLVPACFAFPLNQLAITVLSKRLQ